MVRRILFWFHLVTGTLTGSVIAMMSFTGLLLAWQHEIVQWADGDFHRTAPNVATSRQGVEALLRRLAGSRGSLPTALTLRADPQQPVAAEYGRQAVVYLNPWTGEVLGEGSRKVRAFFHETENWHRWLALGGEQRATGRNITGLSNVLFAVLLISGAYLWLPKAYTSAQLRPRFWFQRGQSARAREWNWHHTIGIWCLLPLLVIVLTGVVMSYRWANDLVYRATGSPIPSPTSGGGRGGGRMDSAPAANVGVDGIDALWQKAQTMMPGWRSITMRVPGLKNSPIVFQLDAGDGRRPDLRAQLTLNRRSGDTVKWEPFHENSAGRRLRSWIRFTHTGEAGGLTGETLAAMACVDALVLVWSGISLATRRLLWYRVRNRAKREIGVGV